MATHKYIGNYPGSHNADWTENLQGVTHDLEHWFFTQEEKIWKFHARKDLNSKPLLADASTQMPDELKDLGCNHFGDPDYFEWNGQGYLFVPVEGGEDCGRKPIVAVFRNERDSLPFVGYSPLENGAIKNSRIGWCAIHPDSRLLYTSHNEIKDDLPIFRHQIDWDALENGDVIIVPESAVTLWQSSELQQQVQIPKYVQGGAFSPDGTLYISSGKMRSFVDDFLNPILSALKEALQGGIYVFDINNDEGIGILKDRSSLVDLPFKYEYHPGFWKYEEPEGLTFWDIQGLNFQVPGIDGHLHAILLDNNGWPFDDEIFFKHYRIE